jgi:hypothetical protein
LKINWFRSLKESLIGNPLQTVLIRKSDLKMYKYSSKYKNIDRLFASNPDQYLDPLDRDMFVSRHQQTCLRATQSPKWLNLSWDAFKQVENHNKSHIFATLKETRGKRRIADIRDFQPDRTDIDAVKEKLKHRSYATMADFVKDMNDMFDSWVDENGTTHKYYPTFCAIRDRFTRQMAKAQQKLDEAKNKSENFEFNSNI